MDVEQVESLRNVTRVNDSAIFDMLICSLSPERAAVIKAAAVRAVLKRPHAFFLTHPRQAPRPALRLVHVSHEELTV